MFSTTRRLSAGAGLAALLFATSASASPYVFEARYAPKGTDQKAVVYPLERADVVPSDVASHSFDGIFFRTRSDDASKEALANLRNFVFRIRHVDDSHLDASHGSFNALDPDAAKGAIVVSPQKLVNGSVHVIDIEVRAKPSAAYLCSQEIEVRHALNMQDKDWDKTVWVNVLDQVKQEEAKESPAPAAKPAPVKKVAAPATKTIEAPNLTPKQLDMLALLVAHAIKDDDVGTVLYSFCSTKESNLIDWEAVGKAMKPQKEAKVAKELHKYAIVKLLLPHLKKVHGEDAAYGKDTPEANENIYFHYDQTVSIMHNLASKLWLAESGERGGLGKVVDQASSIRVGLKGDSCKAMGALCPDKIMGHLTFDVESPDTNGNQVKKITKLLPDGDAFKLDVALRDLLYKGIKINTRFKLGADELAIRTDQTTVETLGLVSSFPLVSEVLTLAKGRTSVSGRDTDIKSSIPLSWAYNASGDDGRHAAITLPWLIGYNPRSAPRLADTVRLFPHMSLVFPLDKAASGGATRDSAAAEGTPQLVVGGGALLVNTFSLAWGMAVDTGAQYTLIGLNVPGLVEIFK